MRRASCRVFHSLTLGDVDQMTAQTGSTEVGPAGRKGFRAGRKTVRAGRSALGNMLSRNTVRVGHWRLLITVWPAGQ